MTDKQKMTPAARLREGSVNAEIWENQTERGTHHRVTFSKSYRDAEGAWHKSASFGAGDLLNLQHLVGRAHDAIRDRQQEKPERPRARTRTRQRDDHARER
ncbi:hypothetical protein [Palleronia rufa]|uniref:hypothetical protein n=1 Tax=Palleronia rufa TaxID=1530186 RepID=UPI00068BCEF4|nr:hypothetical protein [Palleronia rufa]